MVGWYSTPPMPVMLASIAKCIGLLRSGQDNTGVCAIACLILSNARLMLSPLLASSRMKSASEFRALFRGVLNSLTLRM